MNSNSEMNKENTFCINQNNKLSDSYPEWLISVLSKSTVLRLMNLHSFRWVAVWFEGGARQWHFMAVTGDCDMISMQCGFAIIQWYIALIKIHFIHIEFGVIVTVWIWMKPGFVEMHWFGEYTVQYGLYITIVWLQVSAHLCLWILCKWCLACLTQNKAIDCEQLSVRWDAQTGSHWVRQIRSSARGTSTLR